MTTTSKTSSGILTLEASATIVHGADVATATVEDHLTRWGSARVLLVSDPAVQQTDAYRALADTIGGRVAGEFTGTRAHLPRPVVVDAVGLFRKVGADCVVSLGGGSCTDAGKAVRLAAALGIEQASDFDGLSQADIANAVALARPQIAIPTTLAGAEFTHVAGVTNPVNHHKAVLGAMGLNPQVAVLDPSMTAETPDDIWVAGAVKVLSDAVELLTLADCSPLLRPLAERAVSLLSRSLIAGDAAEPHARLAMQMASWMGSFALVNSGSQLGLATALRHVCGPGLAAPHAHVAAVFVAPAYRFNSAFVPTERHASVARGLGLPEGTDPAAITDVLARATAPVATRLSEFSAQRDLIPTLAQAIVRDVSTTANPRTDISPTEVEQLLACIW